MWQPHSEAANQFRANQFRKTQRNGQSIHWYWRNVLKGIYRMDVLGECTAVLVVRTGGLGGCTE